MRILLGLLLLGLAFDSFGARGRGTPPTITANPATADFNFPISPTGQYQKTTTQTFQLTIGGSSPDPTISLQNPVGFTLADATLKSSSGQNISLGGSADVPAGTYDLTISVPDPGQTTSKMSVTVQLDSGRLGKATVDISAVSYTHLTLPTT